MKKLIIMFTTGLLIIIVLALLIEDDSKEESKYNIIYIRDLKMNDLHFQPTIENNPTSESADHNYTTSLHNYHERINIAKDRPRILSKERYYKSLE